MCNLVYWAEFLRQVVASCFTHSFLFSLHYSLQNIIFFLNQKRVFIFAIFLHKCLSYLYSNLKLTLSTWKKNRCCDVSAMNTDTMGPFTVGPRKGFKSKRIKCSDEKKGWGIHCSHLNRRTERSGPVAQSCQAEMAVSYHWNDSW